MELLEFFDIKTRKDFHQWCLEYHPDKSNHPKATARYHLVRAAVDTFIDKKPLSPQEESYNDYLTRMRLKYGTYVCTASVIGAPANLCHRIKIHKSEFCFYHSAEEHLKYVEGDPTEFFSKSHDITLFERSEDTCTTMIKENKYCRNPALPGKTTCLYHA